jgi:hypothetical protein
MNEKRKTRDERLKRWRRRKKNVRKRRKKKLWSSRRKRNRRKLQYNSILRSLHPLILLQIRCKVKHLPL